MAEAVGSVCGGPPPPFDAVRVPQAAQKGPPLERVRRIFPSNQSRIPIRVSHGGSSWDSSMTEIYSLATLWLGLALIDRARLRDGRVAKARSVRRCQVISNDTNRPSGPRDCSDRTRVASGSDRYRTTREVLAHTLVDQLGFGSNQGQSGLCLARRQKLVQRPVNEFQAVQKQILLGADTAGDDYEPGGVEYRVNDNPHPGVSPSLHNPRKQ
jgi:hypothetical protein